MSGIFDQIVTYSPRTVDGSGGTVLLAANNLGDVSSAENARLNLRAASETQAGLRYALPYWQCDGATTNRRFQATGINLAGSDCTLASAWFVMPTSAPASTAYPFSVGASNAAEAGVLFNALMVQVLGNSLRVRSNGAGAGDFRYIDFPNIRSTYSGQWCRLVAAFTGNSTTAPTVWLLTQTGGLTALTGGNDTTGGTPPNWADAALVSTYLLQGYNMPAVPFIPGAIINRRWAQADVEAYVLSGRFSYADAAGGSVVAKYTSNFAAGSDGWTVNGALPITITGNVDGVAGVDDVQQIENPSGASSSVQVARTGSFTPFTRNVITFDYYAEAGAGVTYLGIGAISNKLNEGNNVTVVEGAWQTGQSMVFTPTNDSRLFVAFSSLSGSAASQLAAGKRIYFKNVRITQTGILTDPTNGVQPCYVADDASPNGVPWLAVGYSPVTESKEFRISAKVDMSSTGNKQLLAGALFADPTKVALDTAEDTCAGSPTYSLGDGTTATRYTASVARTAGRLRHTLSNAFPADSAKTGLYANVTASHAGSTAERILVRGHITE